MSQAQQKVVYYLKEMKQGVKLLNILHKSILFNRFACFWPKGYQRGSLRKSHQNGDYLKQTMPKTSKTSTIDLLLKTSPFVEEFFDHEGNFIYPNQRK